jgi:hypothetical protein
VLAKLPAIAMGCAAARAARRGAAMKIANDLLAGRVSQPALRRASS